MIDTDDTDTPDMLAAEYALGTLASNEREQAQGLLANDPAFAQLVQTWEQRLGQLQAMVTPIEPPPETWARIQARIDGVDPSQITLMPHPDQAARIAAESNVVDLTRRLGRWRQSAAGLAAIAAALLAVVVTAAFNPALLPARLRPRPIETVRTVEKEVNPGRFVAVLQSNAAPPAFILTVDVANRTASVRRVTGAPPSGKSYELWLVSERFSAPRSLGLVGANDFSRPTLADFHPTIISSATYAVSLEPEGGSPNGQPSEVLFSSKLLEAVPPSR
jgi:anti-sigma-K factor RskA